MTAESFGTARGKSWGTIQFARYERRDEFHGRLCRGPGKSTSRLQTTVPGCDGVMRAARCRYYGSVKSRGVEQRRLTVAQPARRISAPFFLLTFLDKPIERFRVDSAVEVHSTMRALPINSPTYSPSTALVAALRKRTCLHENRHPRIRCHST